MRIFFARMKRLAVCATGVAFSAVLVASALFLLAADGFAVETPAQFRLGQGDVVEISVWGDQVLTRSVMVRPDGFISFPLIGDVRAEGATVADLRERIEAKMKEFVPDAPVFVMLSKLQSVAVYVVGKVVRPGAFVLERDTTVLQALAMAGGLTPFACENDIVVVRTEDGGQRSLPFRYGDVSSGKKLEQNVVLKPGDTIVVP